MTLETDLYSRLSTAVTLVSGRIYPLVAPQGTTTPYITYAKISAGKYYTHGGAAGLSRDRLQISVYSTGYVTAKAIVTQVVTAMEDWGDIQAAFKEHEIDMFETETSLFHVPVDYFVWHDQ